MGNSHTAVIMCCVLKSCRAKVIHFAGRRRLFEFSALVLLAIVMLPTGALAQPVRGLNTLPARPLSVGYLNALREASGTTAQKIAALNYDGVDIIALAFAGLNSDGSLDLTYGNFDVYRPSLIPQAHAHSRSVLMSIVGDFETVSASATLRLKFATNISNTLSTYGFDGVDFDWEWPNTETERTNFTSMMQAVYATVKARSTNYIIQFVQGPGYWLAGTDWTAVRDYSDFCFCIAYDWKNPANGPIRKPGSVQYLGLDNSMIEAAAKGAIDYLVAHGYPANKIVVGLPFYSSDNRSWFTGSPMWATNRLGFLSAMEGDYREVEFDTAWWTTPDCIKRKMDALLDPRLTVLAGSRVARGIGFWEFGHENTSDPELSQAIHEWRDGDRSVGGLASGPPTNTIVLVNTDAPWRYRDTGVFPGNSWTSRAFDDSAWPQGTAPLGYGDGDETTVVNSSNGRITTYFRRAFTVSNPSAIRSLSLLLLRDDGAIVYLNGTEVFRSNMPVGPVSSNTLASANATPLDESTLFHPAFVDPALLVAGTNVVSVEVHQVNSTSSDLSFNLQLIGQTEPASFVLVPAHATWRYLNSGTNLGTNWVAPPFNDSAWLSGRGRLGYGTDGESTQLLFGTNASAKPITCYFRHAFVCPDPTDFGALQLHLQRDDGVVLYLNGTEILRTNMPDGPIAWTNLASTTISGTDETNWISARIPSTELVAGTNILASEVHQAAPGSSDLGLDLQLAAIWQPPLEIVRSNSTTRLRWSADAFGFRPWRTTSVSPPGTWEIVPGNAVTNGPWLERTISASDPARFYRLSTQ